MGRLATANWSVLAESGLARYLKEVQQLPTLEPNETYLPSGQALARTRRPRGGAPTCHQPFAPRVKIVMGYRGYGLPISEMISEGNIGLIKAVNRFEPEKGFRLATYAVWWIRASIQEYILRSGRW